MIYMGGKQSMAKPILATILKYTDRRDRVLEPFCGGCGMTVALASAFKEVHAFDTHHDLILMWQAAQKGWAPPEEIDRKLYESLRHAPHSALRGFVGHAGALWGKWYGVYGVEGSRKNMPRNISRSIVRDAPKLQNVIYTRSDYRLINPGAGDVVYADPPYFVTAKYRNTFDSGLFWGVARTWVRAGAHVFVSEFTAPEGWDCIWSMQKKGGLATITKKREATFERLFWLDPKKA